MRVPATAWLMLLVVTLIGAWLRCSDLDKSVWIDEVLSLSMASGSLAEVSDRLRPQHMPLYFWILSLFAGVSDDFSWLRIPSVILGIGIIPIVFLIGVELGRVRVGLVAAGLAAVSEFLIHYSLELRMYCLITFLGVLGTWGVARLARQPTGPPARWGWLMLVIASVLNLYSSPFAAFLVATHWCVVGGLVWFHRRMLKPYLFMGTLVALLFLPLVFHMYSMVDGTASVVSGRGWPYEDLYRLHEMTMFHFAGLVTPLEISLVAGSVLGAIIIAQKTPVYALLVFLAFYMPILTFHVVEPKHFFNPRYLSYAQPLMLLLVGASLIWLWDLSIGRWSVAKRVSMLGPLSMSMMAVVLVADSSPVGEVGRHDADWKGLSRTILDAQEENESLDLVVIVPSWNDNTLLCNMDGAAAPGKRVRLIGGSSTSVYRKMRRSRLEAVSPEFFGGPPILLLAKKNLEDLESLAAQHRGRVWVITRERTRLMRQAGFKRVYRLPRYVPYYGGSATRGPALFMRPAR